MKKPKEKSLKYMWGKGSRILQEMVNQKTAKAYKHYTGYFCDWLAKEYGIKRPSQFAERFPNAVEAVQEWANSLTAGGAAASTVHTYLSGVCKVLEISLDKIDKPKRQTASYTRGRQGGGQRGAREAESGKYDDLLTFQGLVGIRRDELGNLKTDDLCTDQAGNICIHVRKGKGGKEQLQVILPQDVPTVAAYFCGPPGTRLFPDELMKNHLNLHALRAQHAREAYTYYASLPQVDRAALRESLLERYQEAGHTAEECLRWQKQIDRGGGVYRLRGACRDHAREHGLPTEYDRLALMAVSVYHLSHWRLDVTIASYMLAV